MIIKMVVGVGFVLPSLFSHKTSFYQFRSDFTKMVEYHFLESQKLKLIVLFLKYETFLS